MFKGITGLSPSSLQESYLFFRDYRPESRLKGIICCYDRLSRHWERPWLTILGVFLTNSLGTA